MTDEDRAHNRSDAVEQEIARIRSASDTAPGRTDDHEDLASYATEIVTLRAALREADRRAGAAEREKAELFDSHAKWQLWLSVAKRDAGYSLNASFDDVWAAALEALNEKRERESQIEEAHSADDVSPIGKA